MTKIEWTEATWNPIVGCSLASPGCTNCYAMQFAGTRLAHTARYDGLTENVKGNHVWTGKLAFDEKALVKPLGWKKPRMIFVNSMGDLFHEDCPDEWIDRVFAVMALCPQHTFQVLTKRSARMREYLTTGRHSEIHAQTRNLGLAELKRSDRMEPHVRRGTLTPLPNVWLGVSVEDQTRADERIPDLLATPAAIRWISAKPLLGPVDLRWIAQPDDERDGVIDALLGCDWVQTAGEEFEPVRPGHEGRKMGRWVVSSDADILANRKLDWVVAGGESGKGARPMHPDWPRALRDQCAAANVPFFFKQWGEFAIGEAVDPKWDDGSPVDPALKPVRIDRVGKKRAGRLLDGAEHNGMPEVVR